MANRSYVYAADELPVPGQARPAAKGVSEWNWDVPLVHRVLLTGNPQVRPSLIWLEDDALAIAGDYATGVANLAVFLAALPHPEAAAQAAEALRFLHQPGVTSRYLWLEPAEILELDDDLGLVEATERLRWEIAGLHDPYALAAAVPPKELTAATGHGSWSSTLYYGPMG